MMETALFRFFFGFLTVWAFAAFCEYFYIESGDWSWVISSAAGISLAGAACGLITDYEDDRHPGDHTPLYWACCLPMLVVALFSIMSLTVFWVILFAGPLVLFIKLGVTLFSGGELGDVLVGWRGIWQWVISISYAIGGVVALAVMRGPYSENPLFGLLWCFMLGFLAVGSFAAFCEFFYIESGDWHRVLRSTIIITVIGSASVAGYAFVLRHPDDHSSLYWMCIFPALLMIVFCTSSALAFFAALVVGPLVLLVGLIVSFLSGGGFGDISISWQNVLHYTVLISYVVGGLGGIVFGIPCGNSYLLAGSRKTTPGS